MESQHKCQFCDETFYVEKCLLTHLAVYHYDKIFKKQDEKKEKECVWEKTSFK